MGATFVVDASVVVDYLARAKDSTDSLRFIGGLSWPIPLVLMAPDVIFLETANALRNLTLNKTLTRTGADKAVAALGRMPIAAVTCSSVLDGSWALAGSVTAYDGAYLALARELDVPYVTRDRPAARAAAQMRIRAWHVSDPDLHKLLGALEPSSPR